MEIDEFSCLLLPSDIPIIPEEQFQLKAIKCLGNGNCLYNAVSICLTGMYQLCEGLPIPWFSMFLDTVTEENRFTEMKLLSVMFILLIE